MSISPQIHSIREATLTVSASDSRENYADYRCDGTNDNVEIQAALDALPATGGEVRLLDGTYNIEVSLVLDSYQTLRGQGRNTILTTTTADVDIITATGGSGSEKVGILIADLCVDGNDGGAVNDIGILWTYVDYSKIRDIWSLDNGEHGIQLISSDFNELIGNTIQGNDRGIFLYDSSSNNIVSGNTCQGNYGGIKNDAASNENLISVNICQGSTADGIFVHSSYSAIISDNVCQLNGIAGIQLSDAHDHLVSNNICLENSQTTDNTISNIVLFASNYNLLIGNMCRQGALANQPIYGIRIAGATCNKNCVISNDLHDAGKTANFNDAGTCTTVMNNRDAEITDVRDLVKVKNTSGGALAAGDVVILKSVAAGNEIITTAVLGDDKVFGMVAEAIANTESGLVLIQGKTTVLSGSNDHGAIVIGDFLVCNDTVKEACLAAAGDMAFAISLEDCDAANQALDALLIVPRKI